MTPSDAAAALCHLAGVPPSIALEILEDWDTAEYYLGIVKRRCNAHNLGPFSPMRMTMNECWDVLEKHQKLREVMIY